MNFEHEKTNEILKWFEDLSKIPRCSKHEEKIGQWLVDWANEYGFENKMDKVGNIVIKVPASPGFENSPITVIQGHQDMVCEKTKDSTHDFSRDPIKFVYVEESDGYWLKADRTTLGSDNGIAIAMAIVLAMDKETPHPPLELLFTVDEETGLTGANALEPGFIDGKILLNVDSEDEGVFTVGCAGGINAYLTVPMATEAVPTGYKPHKVVAGGMKGGHSGIDIALGKANAIKVLGRALNQIQKEADLRVADIKGGSAHNAIPRDAEAMVFFPEKDWQTVKGIVAEVEQTLKDEFRNTDPDLNITLEQAQAGSDTKMSTADDTKKISDFIAAVPHGVDAMSTDIGGLVETSDNLANIKFEDGSIKALTSQRSSVPSRLDALTTRIEGIARLAGGEGIRGEGYPPWKPNMDSPLLARSIRVYEGLANKKPVVEVIHAGLECGIIGDKNPGMDMISFGPTLKYPHSPDEKIHLGTIGMVWDFMAALLKDLK